MREIKFRAWNKKNKRWYKGNESCLAISEHGDLYQISHDGVGWDISDEYDVLFFTGLLDRHGKEIFEGDVVKIDTNEIGVVRWDNGREYDFMYGWNIDWLQTTGQTLSIIIKHKPEIIGNIYENSDLLV
jgi:uncharacterized phage protein (TIGR01671 family)